MKDYTTNKRYDDPSKYPLLPFLNDWLDKVHIHKIQESTYYGYKSRVNGKMKKYFSDRITLADCKPRLIHGFYPTLTPTPRARRA